MCNVQCNKWHKSELDRRVPAAFQSDVGYESRMAAHARWLPVNLSDLPSKSAHSYDPRIYKSRLCERFPNCTFGIYCTFAHSERERDQAAKFRDQLREHLLALAPPVAAPIVAAPGIYNMSCGCLVCGCVV